MSIPISIFKDQQDPVIGPEWTYPGIYENKIACQLDYTSELFEMERSNSFKSEWQRNKLDNHVQRSVRRVGMQMAVLNMKQIDVFHKERGGAKTAATAVPPKAAGAK